MRPQRLLIALLSLALVIALVPALGCAPASQQRAARGTEAKPYDFEREGEIPPARQDVAEEPDVEEMPVTADDLDVEEAEAPPDTTPRPVDTPPIGPPPRSTDGFRVQVFASQDASVAEAARRTAQARLGMAAYAELVDGLYKVRVGDCRTREEAEKVLATCRAVFYKDAWIVETRVNVPAGQ